MEKVPRTEIRMDLKTSHHTHFNNMRTEWSGNGSMWFYDHHYDLQTWLEGIIVHLPRWINCSCELNVIDVLAGDPGKV